MSGNTFLGPRGPIDFRGGPHAGVAPSSNGFGGGALNRASRPTDVQGGFSIVKADAGTPTNVTSSGVIEARNNRGSNIRIPYARLTPMHGKDQLQVDDDRVPVRSGKRMAFEYDGLEAGELAWIMSKTFKPPTAPEGAPHISLAEAVQYHSLVSSHTADLQAPIPLPYGMFDDVTKGGDNSLMNQAGVLNGFGVDRMQRLAYTNWVEAYYRQRLGRQWIDMCAADLGDPMFRALDSTLDDFRLLISGASLFAVPDLTHALEYLPPDAPLSAGAAAGVSNYVGQTMQPLPQGLFILEQGPFLRSMGASTEVSTIRVPFADPEEVPAHANVPDMSAGPPHSNVTFSMSADRTAPRHLGGELAQRGLYALLKKHGVFNWTPDGIVLSKLETGPSPDADAYLDAKQGQMFNVSVQGPAITKTWTGDPKMACQPMDKVFVLVVGDIDYKLADADGRAALLGGEGDNDRVNDEGTMLLCKRISQSLRTIMRKPAGGAARDVFPQMSKAPNTVFSGVNVAAVDVADALTFDTTPSPRNKIFRAFGTPDPAGADLLRDSLSQLRTLANQRRASKSDTAKASAMRELWIQVTSRATYYEMAYRQSGNNASNADVQLWYDNNAVHANDNNRTNDAPTRTNHRGLKQLLADLDAMLKGFTDVKRPTEGRTDAFGAAFKTRQTLMLNGRSTVAVATLCNLRLMRCTSSYLAQYSFPEETNPHSRLGLNITYEDADAGKGLTSFVLGGWCVGTVLDSAASRSMQGPMVRVAPQSMAMNVNVNIEWWSADKLHQHYGDPASWDLGPVGGGASKRVPSVRSRADPRHGVDIRREGRAAGVLHPGLAVGLAVSSAQALPNDNTKQDRYITPADNIAPDSDVGRENAIQGGNPAGFLTTD